MNAVLNESIIQINIACHVTSFQPLYVNSIIKMLKNIDCDISICICYTSILYGMKYNVVYYIKDILDQLYINDVKGNY